jgi:enterochelin esterase-like enzyme
VDIYVPAGYEEQATSPCSEGKMHAVYLLHGIAGYEGSWVDLGSATDTLDTLIAAGLCPPVILVMPDCNKWPFVERPSHHNNLWKCIFHYGRLRNEHTIELALSDLLDMMDSTYCISECSMAGLSDGARMAANLANIRSDRVRRVGMFTPVVYKDQLPADTSVIYQVYAGKKDIFLPNAKRFRRRLSRSDYPHYEYFPLKESHNWHMWRRCLSLFLRQPMPAPQTAPEAQPIAEPAPAERLEEQMRD